MKATWIYAALFAAALLSGQEKRPDLIGTLTFQVDSPGGRIENLIVTIGDGGTGPYKAVLSGDSSLPTHAIYRPRDLSSFGSGKLLPIVAFGNGGCRNGSGEFRNFLSDVASHGFVVVAIGPAGDAVVGGSEGRQNQTKASELLDGVEWVTKENERQGSDYFHKVDTSKLAVMGQSCGTRQAAEVSSDTRVTTTVLLNGGPNLGGATGQGLAAAGNAQQAQAPGAYGNTNAPASNQAPLVITSRLAKRYAPYAPAEVAVAPVPRAPTSVRFHGPVAFINGGPSDIAYNGAVAAFAEVTNVPALLAFQDVGHYPATYREPNGGAFAVAVNAWLDWTLRGNQKAAQMFAGPSCGLCADPKWHIQAKNIK